MTYQLGVHITLPENPEPSSQHPHQVTITYNFHSMGSNASGLYEQSHIHIRHKSIDRQTHTHKQTHTYTYIYATKNKTLKQTEKCAQVRCKHDIILYIGLEHPWVLVPTGSSGTAIYSEGWLNRHHSNIKSHNRVTEEERSACKSNKTVFLP